MPLINCKVEPKLKWTSYCVLAVAGNDNIDDNSDNIIFSIKNTKLLTLCQQKTIKKYQNFLANIRFKRSVYWNEYKAKGENKNTIQQYGYFLESNFPTQHATS